MTKLDEKMREVEEISAKIKAWRQMRFYDFDPESIATVMNLVFHLADELEPSIQWSAESGGWQIKLEGAQMEYCKKDDLAIGICRAIVAAKRL